jgi:ATP-dependent RNA helicase DeaD
MIQTFKDLPLSQGIQQALEALGFTEPTEIQKKAIPLLLGCGKLDFHGQAQTGTGKTLAFGIPLLHRIEVGRKVPQALIVAPTRELAMQIRESIQKLARSMEITTEVIYGGVSMEEQVRAIQRGTHIIVGTPGRLNDHLRRKTLSVAEVRTLVLDEADIMLDMGFREEIEEIFNYTPKGREIWLFSATVKAGISDLMRTYMAQPVSICISKEQVATENTKQYFCVVPSRVRIQALKRFIESTLDFYGFIFCQTKIATSDVADALVKEGYNVGALHGDMGQVQRNLVINKFRKKELSIVVATDVAARGIDVSDLTHVINYSLPDDHESYVHRIGRTGRAGKEGIAITLITKNELRLVQALQRKFNVSIAPLDVPTIDDIIKIRIKEAAEYVTNALKERKDAPHPSLVSLIHSLTEEQLRALTLCLIENTFLKCIDTQECQFIPSSALAMPDSLHEIFINVGSDDGITKEDVVAYLTKTGYVQREQIQKVRVIKRRTFVELPQTAIEPLMDVLQGKFFGGRRARITVVSEQPAS